MGDTRFEIIKAPSATGDYASDCAAGAKWADCLRDLPPAVARQSLAQFIASATDAEAGIIAGVADRLLACASI